MTPSLKTILNDLLSGSRPWPAYLYGRTGVGKTCLGLLLFDWYESMWLEARELAEHCWDADSVIWRQAATMPLVIVDEVGTETGNRTFIGIKRLADIRQRRPTVWLSNLPPEQLLRAFDERIYSRLCCGTVVEMKGADQRFGDR